MHNRICNGRFANFSKKLLSLCSLYGKRSEVIKRLDELLTTEEEREALSELRLLDELLNDSAVSDFVRYDFSVVGNMNYYNGIVFNGFVDGICREMLVGGSYDKLLNSMRVDGRAIGFALYLDLIRELDAESDGYDVDVLLLYSKDTSPAAVAREKRRLIEAGKAVYSATVQPAGLRYREIVEIR